LAKAAIEICAKFEHPLGSLRQAAKRYTQALHLFFDLTFVIEKIKIFPRTF
jgi:hypothetical protein